MAKIQGELEFAQLQNAASDLTPPSTGLIYYNTTVGPKVYNGTVWKILADLDSSQVFTNKDIDGGTASNTSRVTIPKDTKANLDILTRKQATLLYATDQNKFYGDDGTQLKGVGSGTGEKNYVTNSDDSGNWIASGAGITVATVTTGSILPEESKSSGIKFTGVSGTDYARFRFTIDDGDKSKKLKIQLYMKSDAAYASNDFSVQMWTNTASNYGGTYAQLAVQTDPQIFKDDNGSLMLWTFDSDTSDYYELRIVRNAGTAFIVASGVIVGPGTISKGAVATDWIPMTLATSGMGTITGDKCIMRRVGSSLQMKGYFTTGSLSGSAAAVIGLPAGLNIDTSQLSDTRSQLFGKFHQLLASATDLTGSTFAGVLTFVTGDTTTLSLATQSVTNLYSVGFANAVLSGGATISFDIEVPIAEWAGVGTMNILAEENLTKWKSYSPTLGAGTILSAFDFTWRRVGENMEIRGAGTWNAGASGTFAVGLPAGFHIDLTNYSLGSAAALGFGSVFQSPYTLLGFPQFIDNVTLGMYATYGITSFSVSGLNVTPLANLNNGDQFEFQATIKIVEFANSQNGLVGFAGATLTQMGLIKKYEEGSFVGMLGGMTGGVPITVNYVIVGNTCTLSIVANTGTSSATTMNMTGEPAQILPATVNSILPIVVQDNGSNVFGLMAITPSGILFYPSAAGGSFTASGSKGLGQGLTVTYPLT